MQLFQDINVITILQELGNLALAVVQAGAYIFQAECGFDRYLHLHRERRGALLEEYRDNVQKMDDYKWTVHTTWEISFKRLSEQSAIFLQFCSFLHHEGISEAIFRNAASNMTSYVPWVHHTAEESNAVSKAKDFLGGFRTSDSPWDSQKFLKMIMEIRSYSLVDFDSANETYSMHPLVHAWTRTTMSKEEVTRTSVMWMLGLSAAWEFSAEAFSFRRSLQAHMDNVLKGGRFGGPEFAGEFGLIYHEGGRWKEAEELQVQVKEARLRLLGAQHPDTITSISSLAETYHSQGRWKEAEELQVQVKEAYHKVFGAEHPYTLKSMGSLASTYHGQGRWKEAEELQVQVKEARHRLLGAQHPDTITSISSLASTYRSRGRWKEAEKLQVQVRADYLQLLGADHPYTLISMENLGLTYRNQGRWKEAEELQVKVKEAYHRLLGAEHPYTLTSMERLASTYQGQGRWKEAEELRVQVKEARHKLLGAEHPDTLNSMSNLAFIYHKQEQWKEAKQLEVHKQPTLWRRIKNNDGESAWRRWLRNSKTPP